MTQSKEAIELAARLTYQGCDGEQHFVGIKQATQEIDTALADREAQAVQREREAARGLVKELRESIVDLLGFDEKYTPEDILPSLFPKWARENVAKADAYCATYNDNRKG